MGLTEFLTARLAEDEAVARAALENALGIPGELAQQAGPCVGEAAYEHIARHDPARVLREVTAMRAILAMDSSTGSNSEWSGFADAKYVAMHALAFFWEDHPDYDPTWGPPVAAAQ